MKGEMDNRAKLPGARGILTALVLVIGLLALPQGAWATSATWSGATNFDYNTLTNWAGAPASIPGTNAGETATFTNTGAGNVGISAATANAVGFNFSNVIAPGSSYTITVANGVNQGLTGMTSPGTGLVTLAGTGTGTYTLTGACPFNIGGETYPINTTVSGVITDGTSAGSLTKDGIGILSLTGANTYSGGTTLNAGTLGIGVDSVVSGGVVTSGALGTGTLTVATGPLTVTTGNLQAVGADHTLANNIVILNNAVLSVNEGYNLTLNGVISGAGALYEGLC
jgi:autotransporter-associated beta strand protein